ncbi:hypothetical protein B0H17DRAFT_1090626, partial [Mycena rosella]
MILVQLSISQPSRIPHSEPANRIRTRDSRIRDGASRPGGSCQSLARIRAPRGFGVTSPCTFALICTSTSRFRSSRSLSASFFCPPPPPRSPPPTPPRSPPPLPPPPPGLRTEPRVCCGCCWGAGADGCCDCDWDGGGGWGRCLRRRPRSRRREDCGASSGSPSGDFRSRPCSCSSCGGCRDWERGGDASRESGSAVSSADMCSCFQRSSR